MYLIYFFVCDALFTKCVSVYFFVNTFHDLIFFNCLTIVFLVDILQSSIQHCEQVSVRLTMIMPLLLFGLFLIHSSFSRKGDFDVNIN